MKNLMEEKRSVPDLYISFAWRYKNYLKTLISFMNEEVGEDKWTYTLIPGRYMSFNENMSDISVVTMSLMILNKMIRINFHKYRTLILLGGQHANPEYKEWVEREIMIAKRGWRVIILVEIEGNGESTQLERESADFIVKLDNSFLEALKKVPDLTDKIVEDIQKARRGR